MLRARIASQRPGFAHVVAEDGQRLFVHQNECDFLLADAQLDDVVDIAAVQEDPRGPRALGVTWVEASASGEPIAGTVTRVQTARGFAFMRPDGGGPDVFLHARDFRDRRYGRSDAFDRLVPGDRVTCQLQPSHSGPRGARIEIERV